MSIDMTWEVLPPGVHNAAVHEVDFKFGTNVSIVLTYRVPHGGEDYFVSEWLTVDAPKTSTAYNSTAEGKGRIKQLYEVYGIPLPKKLEPAEIISALVGKTYRLTVSTRVVNGLRAPKVSGVLSKADKPVPPLKTGFPADD
jgi:hypothetical protein